jgi:CheY-like chemotaxis protein
MMNIVCPKCSAKFRISAEKIPAGHPATIPCPKCKTKITLNSAQAPAGNPVPSAESNPANTYDSSDRPFDFIEEEGLTAIVCEKDPRAQKTIVDALNLMDYQITVAESARDALKRMRYHVYDLVVVDELFDTSDPDTNGIMIYVERLPMATRRNMFVAMISNRYRTMDNMMAFNKSVNLIINMKNIEDIGKILSRSITDNELFYRIYKETLKETGRI